jgi:hypothetical protein
VKITALSVAPCGMPKIRMVSSSLIPIRRHDCGQAGVLHAVDLITGNCWSPVLTFGQCLHFAGGRLDAFAPETRYHCAEAITSHDNNMLKLACACIIHYAAEHGF